jgi:hypothetical protein
VIAWFGNKYSVLSEVADEVNRRAHAVSDAAVGRR